MTQSYPRLKRQSRRKDRSNSSIFASDGVHFGATTTQRSFTTWNDQVMLGKSPDGWKYKLANGSDVTSTLDGYKQVHGNAGLAYTHTGTKTGFRDARITVGVNVNGGSETTYPSAVVDSYAEYKAASKLLGSYISATNTWRGGNFIAEFAETVQMLAHPLKSLYSHTWSFVGNVGKLKKVYRRDPVRYGRLLGGAWLAYAFGIKPLVDDINDAQSAVDHLANELGACDTLPIKGYGTAETLESQYTGASVPQCPYARFDEYRVSRSKVKYYGAIRAAPMNFPSVATDFGVGFADIVPAVWEAVPWSFLVDYFVNVGEVLDSARLASANLAWLAQGKSVELVSNSSDIYPAYSVANPLGYVVTAGGGRAVAKRVWKHRVGVGSIPYPGFNFRIPGISSLKWCNVAALTAQIAGSRPLK